MILHKCPNCGIDNYDGTFQKTVTYSVIAEFNEDEIYNGKIMEDLGTPSDYKEYYCDTCGAEFNEFIIEERELTEYDLRNNRR